MMGYRYTPLRSRLDGKQLKPIEQVTLTNALNDNPVNLQIKMKEQKEEKFHFKRNETFHIYHGTAQKYISLRESLIIKKSQKLSIHRKLPKVDRCFIGKKATPMLKHGDGMYCSEENAKPE